MEKIASQILKLRIPLLSLLTIMTIFLGYHALHLKVATDFSNMIPLGHEYIKGYEPFKSLFGGGNQIKVSVSRRNQTIMTKEFLLKLREITEDVMFIKGVDRLKVRSLISPETVITIVS